MLDTITIRPGQIGADYVRLTDAIEQCLIERHMTFVARYAVPEESTSIGKVITDDEIAWLHEHAIAIVVVWEINARDGYRGAEGGRRAGSWLRQWAEEHDYPTAVPLFCAIDTNTTAVNVSVFEQFVRAFDEQIGRHPLGLYGDTDIAEAVADLDPVVWRPAASSWSSGTTSPHIAQGLSESPGIDPNIAVRPFPAWLPHRPSQEVPDMIAIRPAHPDLSPGLFTVDGQPISRELADALGNELKIVDQDHAFWDEATLHKMGEQARRLYRDWRS